MNEYWKGMFSLLNDWYFDVLYERQYPVMHMDESKTLCRENTQTVFNSLYFSSIKITATHSLQTDTFSTNINIKPRIACISKAIILALTARKLSTKGSDCGDIQFTIDWIICNVFFFFSFSEKSQLDFIFKKILEAFHKNLVHLSLTFNLDFCSHVFWMVNSMRW